ncbi:MAG: hypothetical protein SGPRY_004955, partial [Prymnesium sp.]
VYLTATQRGGVVDATHLMDMQLDESILAAAAAKASGVPRSRVCFPVYGSGTCAEFNFCSHASAAAARRGEGGRGVCLQGLCLCHAGYGGLACEMQAECRRWDETAAAWSSEGVATLARSNTTVTCLATGLLTARTDYAALFVPVIPAPPSPPSAPPALPSTLPPPSPQYLEAPTGVATAAGVVLLLNVLSLLSMVKLVKPRQLLQLSSLVPSPPGSPPQSKQTLAVEPHALPKPHQPAPFVAADALHVCQEAERSARPTRRFRIALSRNQRVPSISRSREGWSWEKWWIAAGVAREHSLVGPIAAVWLQDAPPELPSPPQAAQLLFVVVDFWLLFTSLQYRYAVVGVRWGEAAFPSSSRLAALKQPQNFLDRSPVMFAVGLSSAAMALTALATCRTLFLWANRIEEGVDEAAAQRAAKGGCPIRPSPYAGGGGGRREMREARRKHRRAARLWRRQMREWKRQGGKAERRGRRAIGALWCVVLSLSLGASIGSIPISSGISLPFATQDFWVALLFSSLASWLVFEPLFLCGLWKLRLFYPPPSRQQVMPLTAEQSKPPALLRASFLLSDDLTRFDLPTFTRALSSHLGLPSSSLSAECDGGAHVVGVDATIRCERVETLLLASKALLADEDALSRALKVELLSPPSVQAGDAEEGEEAYSAAAEASRRAKEQEIEKTRPAEKEVEKEETPASKQEDQEEKPAASPGMKSITPLREMYDLSRQGPPTIQERIPPVRRESTPRGKLPTGTLVKPCATSSIGSLRAQLESAGVLQPKPKEPEGPFALPPRPLEPGMQERIPSQRKRSLVFEQHGIQERIPSPRKKSLSLEQGIQERIPSPMKRSLMFEQHGIQERIPSPRKKSLSLEQGIQERIPSPRKNDPSLPKQPLVFALPRSCDSGIRESVPAPLGIRRKADAANGGGDRAAFGAHLRVGTLDDLRRLEHSPCSAASSSRSPLRDAGRLSTCMLSTQPHEGIQERLPALPRMRRTPLSEGLGTGTGRPAVCLGASTADSPSNSSARRTPGSGGLLSENTAIQECDSPAVPPRGNTGLRIHAPTRPALPNISLSQIQQPPHVPVGDASEQPSGADDVVQTKATHR